MKWKNVPLALHTVAWMMIGAVIGFEATFFVSEPHGLVVVLVALMNYALFTCIWGVGYAMGAYENATHDIGQK